MILAGGTPHRRREILTDEEGLASIVDTRTEADLLWEDVASLGWFAEVYGWTPEQVEALPRWYADRVRAFHDLVIEVAEDKHRSAGNSSADGPGASSSPYVKGPVVRRKSGT